ncbi:MAG: DNA-processing protein DprA [Acutalibacteraceae bacterium]|nr:DNA-processing protein DprA [Acutalibacteraceae bacterium]
MTEYFIWLQGALGAGNIRAVKALKYFGNAENIYKASPSERKAAGMFSPKDLSRLSGTKIDIAKTIIDDCRKYGIDIIPLGDKKYPYCLSVIDNPPIVLYLKGEMLDFDNTPAICIVGPRKVSDYGKKAAYSLAYRLSKSGMTVVSGGAVGSDYYAHVGALKAGCKTALVMPCGIESGYLSQNAPLRKCVSENGCIISELPPKAGLTKFSFHIRNRIMSALSLGTVVVEAGEKSGALITANHALNQGRDVFVIPGLPTEKHYVGSNALLRDGAKPLLDVSDIFNEYIPRFPDKIDIKKAFEKPQKRAKKTEKKEVYKKLSNETLSKEAKIVYNHLDKHKFYPDEIGGTDLGSSEILSALIELELEGLVRALPGGRYELCDRNQ